MQAIKVGRIVLGLLLNLLAVLIGTAILSSVLGRGYWHPHTIQSLLRVSYSYDIIAAGLLGFFIYRRFRTITAKWVWVIAVLWFLIRTFTLIGSASPLWPQLSGSECIQGTRAIGCTNWFLFTMPLVRAVAYSAGAWLCSHFSPPLRLLR